MMSSTTSAHIDAHGKSCHIQNRELYGSKTVLCRFKRCFVQCLMFLNVPINTA